jgi:hypothetical protein
MSAANPNPMEKSMVSVLVVANAGGGSPFMEVIRVGYTIMDLAIPPPPPSLTTVTDTSSAMEEMSLQLCGVLQDLQDVLDTVRHTAGKRKCATSTNHDVAELTSPTTRQPTPQ